MGWCAVSDETKTVEEINRKIDRMDRRALFTSHYTRDGKRTLCGLSLVNCYTQPWCDNGFCRRCEKIAARCQIQTSYGVFEVERQRT